MRCEELEKRVHEAAEEQSPAEHHPRSADFQEITGVDGCQAGCFARLVGQRRDDTDAETHAHIGP